MEIKKELLKLAGSKYLFDYTENILNLLIEKDESNRELIEKELSKVIEKEHIERMEELRRDSEASRNYNVNIGDPWFR